MDDFEDNRVRKLRGMPRDEMGDARLPCGMRGKKICTCCKGRGGSWVKQNNKLNTSEWHVCETCKATGEVDA